METYIVLAVVVLAVAYLIKKIYKSMNGTGGCGSCGGGCSHCIGHDGDDKKSKS